MTFIPPLCHSNCRTCYYPSNSHHQTVTQSILPAVLLLSLTFLNLSLALVSSHFWQKRALLYYPVWRRKAQNPLWFPSFYPAFSMVAMNSHTEFLPTDLILHSVPSGFSLEIMSFQIQQSTPRTWNWIFSLHLHCPSTFICFYKLFVMLHFTSRLPLLFAFWLGIQHLIQHLSFLFFPTFNMGSHDSILCLCLFTLPISVTFTSTFPPVYRSITGLPSAVQKHLLGGLPLCGEP